MNLAAFADFIGQAVHLVATAGHEHWQIFAYNDRPGTDINLELNSAGQLSIYVVAGNVLCTSTCDPHRFGMFLHAIESQAGAEK